MKRCLSFIIVLGLLLSLSACRKTPDSDGSSAEISVLEKTVYIEAPNEDPTTPQPTQKVFQSTIETPDHIYFYSDGKYGTSTDKNLNRKIAKHIEAWFKDYETPPTAKLTVDYDLITDITCNEKVIELRFYNNSEINLLGTFALERANRLLIPITGKYKYCVFVGYDGKYQGNPYLLNGSGLKKYFDGITFDKKAQDWQSTVIAPTTVTFYKDGMQTVSTDKDLNHKIARHIEEWFKYEETIVAAGLHATTNLINYNRRNEMAIELNFDGEIKFYGGVMYPSVRTLFIPLTGDYEYLIFHNSIEAPDDWTGPLGAGSGLEQYFDDVQFTPLTQEEKRWRSTVETPSTVKFYKNGELIGETSGWGEKYQFNYEIAKHIESWFYKKENIPTVAVSNKPLETAWGSDTYIELWIDSGITFYGEQIVSEKSSCLIIPLTGEYAYHIFEGGYNEFSNIAYVTDGEGLEQFFKRLTVDNDNIG